MWMRVRCHSHSRPCIRVSCGSFGTIHTMFDLPLALLVLLTGVALLVLGWCGWDERLVAMSSVWRQELRQLTPTFTLLSWTPLPVAVLFLLPAFVWFIAGDIVEAVAITASCSIALGLAFLGKFIFMRARPLDHLTYIGETDSSFPSAHTAGPFAAAFILADVTTSGLLMLVALLAAAAVAFSRIWLQLHFLSDIAGGFLVAYVASYFVTQSSFLPFLLSAFT